ncbi:hypothetical protein [Leptospira brenneri]|uniref:hypothetical protein n=1 Tax=Leptospira brenneri TaxID=2023182 RepID=UPI000C2A8E9B|nr:hypothetical protein [Leptospira brenneri]PJZ43785.1 hypothetical protein CH361_18710 [Leptospira brenneri]
MGKHQLITGKRTIAIISELGKALGYHVKHEYPVRANGNPNEAVDVAWLFDELQEFPLFIFEIESNSTNSMVYNPTKVFSQEASKFSKPLFLFQLILKGSSKSGVYTSLENQFGKFNYKAIILSEVGWSEVLYEILLQHRRLTLEFDTVAFLIFLNNNSDKIIIDSSFLINLYNLNYLNSNRRLLANYARLSIVDKTYKEAFSHLLNKLFQEEEKGTPMSDYDTYYGDHWYRPLHIGLVYYFATENEIKLELIEKFKSWQEKNSFMTMIGPHFGLNYDYDTFLILNSGFLLTNISCLLGGNKEITEYCGNILLNIIKKSREDNKINNLIWLYHLITPHKKQLNSLYKWTIEQLYNLECLNADILLFPYDEPLEEDEWLENIKNLRKNEESEYTESKIKEKLKNEENEDIYSIAIEILTNIEFDQELKPKILTILHYQIGDCI